MLASISVYETWSHPARGAWIEMYNSDILSKIPFRRTPQGVRGLKYAGVVLSRLPPGRTPQGVRGLKSDKDILIRTLAGVAPRKGCVD